MAGGAGVKAVGRRLVVSLHDVHPGSFEAVRGQVEFLEGLGVGRFSLLVIPDYHGRGRVGADGGLSGWLRERAAAGDEIVQHGYHHLRIGARESARTVFWTRVYTRNEAEFLDLEGAEAARLLREGRAALREAGLSATGFIAPAWLMSAGSLAAIFDEGFAYTNTAGAILPGRGWRVRARTWCWSARARWRRAASLGWNALVAGRVLRQGTARLSLHPDDLRFAPIRRQIGRLARRALEAGFLPGTYAEVCAELRDGGGCAAGDKEEAC